MNTSRLAAFAAFLCMAATTAAAQAPCHLTTPDRLAGFSSLDAMIFVDLPDPIATRATSTVESSFVDQVISEEISAFSKTWCEIGLQTMVVDFEVPVEDDAVKSILTRAVYIWDTQMDPVGWRLDAIGERQLCARGNDPFAEICP
ncbi:MULTISPECIES: hypothetical protein [Rhodobacterales]|uniref:hypothetical protein n=1 Tax=Rhodobacterales TaxID=204455 RepID=UPI0011BDEBEF|nr:MULTISPECIES: hypothetical protein [Rhodobacterales]MDO6591216.1 hypothetical protein [Yoonia sp. 1_MG-2023]